MFSPVFLLIFSVVCIQTTPKNLSFQTQPLKLSIPSGWSDLHLQSSVEIVNNNFESRYKYGNKQNNGLKIMHWNAGGKYLLNKINNIESLINGHRPEIWGICEANFLKNHDIQDVQIENYQLYFSDTLNNDDIAASRIVVYVHNDMQT